MVTPYTFTLREQLNALNGLEQQVGSLFVDNPFFTKADNKFSSASEAVLMTFLQHNPLVYAVAKGEESYVRKIQPICERYDSVWKRVRLSVKDEAFDTYVDEILGSMNSVGEVSMPVDNFKLTSRREEFLQLNKSSGVMGLMMGSLFGAPPYFSEITYGKLLGVGIFSLSVLGFPGLINGIQSGKTHSFVKELYLDAEKTDTFLRETYIKHSGQK